MKKFKKIIATVLTAAIASSSAMISSSAKTVKTFLGDYDLDGYVTSAEALAVLRISTDPFFYVYGQEKMRIDIDEDGKITSNDALLILQKSVGMDSFADTEDIPYSVPYAINNFAVENLKEVFDGENTIISPYSMYDALAMLNNGAAGDTYKEITDVLSGEETLDIADINSFINKYMELISKGKTLKTANSIFVMDRDDIKVKQEFIDTLQKEYSAEVFHATPDQAAVDRINLWSSENTNGRIPMIIDELNPDTVSVLLNAVYFKADWWGEFDPARTFSDKFTNYDGSKSNAEYMSNTEYSYIRDKFSTGFIKRYMGDSVYDDLHNYAFVAILPNEDISIDEYVNNMTSDTIHDLVKNCTSNPVDVLLPKFSFECSYLMNEPLMNMGMPSAFSSGEADFSELTEGGGIHVSKVLHKTFINLTEGGTEAAAVTAIIEEKNSPADFELHKKVYLNRPFVFSIYDLNNDIPLFIGVVCDF